ncbi:MAG: type II secretion system protein GspF [Nitrospira sp.]|nr:type II secretion system protein GspF [Nitrospira sp.]
MPLFIYEAVDSSGKRLKESIEATNEESLKNVLRERGLLPISIKTGVETRTGFFSKRITSKDLLIFTQELSNLLESGLPLDKALFVLSEHSEKRGFRSIIGDIYRDIQRGQSLSQAMGKHKVFPRLYVNMIKSGEAGGMVETVLRRLVAFLETTTSFKEEVTSALIYPLLLTVVGGLAVAVLMLYVIPEFSKIFADMGQALPLPTLILLKASQGIASYWWAIGCALAGVIILIRVYAKTSEGRNYLDNFKIRFPLVQKLIIRLIIARFSRTLGTMLQSGVPILEAIKISREVVGNEVISAKLDVLEEGVRRGRGIASPLKESGVFPPVVAQMVAVGEEAGRLEETFLLIADRFEAESRSLIKRVVSLFEPALILLMGLVVGFIVISMLIGIFSINEIPI